MQQQKPLGDGTAIHITIARYYTPSGRSIQNEGITPDVEVLQSKVEVIEKKESMYSEASFKNSLKNDKTKKKGKKKSDKGETDSDEEVPFEELTDEEKDARDYQLQRAMGMVVAMGKVQSRGYVVSDQMDSNSEEVEVTEEN